MKSLCLRSAGLCLLGACMLLAQDWKSADTLPGVDLTTLTAAQKTTALKILRDHGCSCGCNMKLAECRVVDPNCSFSKGLAAAIIDVAGMDKPPRHLVLGKVGFDNVTRHLRTQLEEIERQKDEALAADFPEGWAAA